MAIQVVNKRADLVALKAQLGVIRRPAAYRVDLNWPDLLKPERKRVLEKRLAFYLSDCGCALASVALLLAPVILFRLTHLSPWPWWPNLLFYAMVALGAALFAKGASLLLTHHLAHRTIDKLLHHWARASELMKHSVVARRSEPPATN